MAILVAAEAVVLVLLALLVAGLLRSHAEILRRLHDLGAGLEDGEGAPRARGVRRDEFNVFPEVQAPPDRDALPAARDLVGTGLRDDAVSVRVVGVDHATLVAFLSSSCLTCARFWDAFGQPDLDLPARTRLVVVAKDAAEESPAKLAELAPRGVTVLLSSRAWADYDVPGSPYFVWVDGDGRVRGEGTGIDWPQVRNLLGQTEDDERYAAELAGRRVNKPDADAAREARIDAELLAAGVPPGDPSLYDPPVLADPADSRHDNGSDADHGPLPS